LLNHPLIDSQRSTIASFARRGLAAQDLANAQGEVGYRDNYLASLHSTLLDRRLIGHGGAGDGAECGAQGRRRAGKTLNEAGAQLVAWSHQRTFIRHCQRTRPG